MPQQQIPAPGYMCPAPPSRLYWYGEIWGNNSYQAGGYNLTAASFGFTAFEAFDVQSYSNNGLTYVLAPDWGNNSNSGEQQAAVAKTLLVKCYYQNNSVEVANNTNLAAVNWRVDARGV